MATKKPKKKSNAGAKPKPYEEKKHKVVIFLKGNIINKWGGEDKLKAAVTSYAENNSPQAYS